jgi:glycine/D-amino acid oxidase-like deaminating enzyme
LSRRSRRDSTSGSSRSTRSDGASATPSSSRPARARASCPELPIELEDRFLFLSEPIRERLLEPLIVSSERRFAAKQLGDGRVLASDLGERGDEAQRETWRATVQAGIEELLPQLAHVSFPVLIQYDMTPDHQPLLGRSTTGSTSRLASAATAS